MLCCRRVRETCADRVGHDTGVGGSRRFAQCDCVQEGLFMVGRPIGSCDAFIGAGQHRDLVHKRLHLAGIPLKSHKGFAIEI